MQNNTYTKLLAPGMTLLMVLAVLGQSQISLGMQKEESATINTDKTWEEIEKNTETVGEKPL